MEKSMLNLFLAVNNHEKVKINLKSIIIKNEVIFYDE